MLVFVSIDGREFQEKTERQAQAIKYTHSDPGETGEVIKRFPSRAGMLCTRFVAFITNCVAPFALTLYSNVKGPRREHGTRGPVLDTPIAVL